MTEPKSVSLVERGPRRMAAGLVICVVLGAVAAVGWSSPVGAAAGNPTVEVNPLTAAPGTRVQVRLQGWPDGPVNVGVCGNLARRGSQDCDQQTVEGVAVRGGSALLLVTVPVPPIGCPCIVRAAKPDNSVVGTVALAIPGVPDSPPVLPTGGPLAADTLVVRARVESRPEDWPRSWLPLVAGSTPRTLVLKLENRSQETIPELRVVGAVGRTQNHGEPLPAESASDLAPGETRRVPVPLELAAPAWGTYEVFGSVYGLATPVRFEATTSNDPWGLEVALVLLLLVMAQIARDGVSVRAPVRSKRRSRFAHRPRV